MVEGNVKRDTNTLMTAYKQVLALVNKTLKKKKRLRKEYPRNDTFHVMILKNNTEVSLTMKSHGVPLCVKYDIISGTYRYETP